MKNLKMLHLKEVAQINPRCRPLTDHLNVSFVAMSDVSVDGKLHLLSTRPFGAVATGYTQFEEGDVLVAKITPCFENGKGALARNLENQRGAGSTEFHVLRPTHRIDGEYLDLICRSSHFRRTGESCMEGSAGQKRIPVGFVRNYRILCPPLPEQRKIANILTTWDEALTKLDALINAQERRKKALMQQLLTGRRRLKGFTTKWKISRFSDFLVESRIHGSDGSTANKLTVKLYGRGVVSKQERLAGSENTRYFRRNAGQFIYSKLDFLNGAFGIVPDHLDGYETTLDVPAFDVCDTADSKWLLYFVSREEFYSQQLGAAAGGRKARRVNPSEFLAMRFPAPSLEEQRQIAAILDTADQQIALLRAQRTALDQQKRGLMQRLLTGKLRVVPDAS